MQTFTSQNRFQLKRQSYVGDKSAFYFISGNTHSGVFERGVIHDGGFFFIGFTNSGMVVPTGKVIIEAWIKPTIGSAVDGEEFTVIGFHDDGGFTNPTRFGLSLVVANGATDFGIRVYADHDGGLSSMVGYEELGWGITPDQWTHFTIKYDKDDPNGEISIYQNGELQDQQFDLNGGGDISGLGSTRLYVGGTGVGGGAENTFNGKIDEVRCWSNRSDEEIATWYNQEIIGTQNNLILYEPMEGNAPSLEVHFDFSPTDVPFQSGLSDPTCYLRPMNEEQSAINGVQYGLGFMIITEVDVDIRQGDKVIVDGVEYTIRGVVNHDRGNLTKYKRALATKGEKQ